MAFSHRDHRARRELRQLYLGFAVVVGVLTVVAILFPNVTIRLLAVAGLAVTAGAYVVAADRLTEVYRRDLTAVRAGQPVSGEVRAEVYHEVGFERDREGDWKPSPHHRAPGRHGESPLADDADTVSPSTAPTRSGPPSNGS